VSERLQSFLELSALLTGFGRVALLGTGVADTYHSTLEAVLPPGVLDELLDAYERLPDGDDREAELDRAILGDPKLGPVARNLILMWYCGKWTELPGPWRAAYGLSAGDVSHVVSGDAYQAGLQWVAAGAHPIGARQQGFGAWAMPPKKSTR
jgi:hypothetical protein